MTAPDVAIVSTSAQFTSPPAPAGALLRKLIDARTAESMLVLPRRSHRAHRYRCLFTQRVPVIVNDTTVPISDSTPARMNADEKLPVICTI
jgi:hypothetical protein